MPWTPEEAREAARKGGRNSAEARRVRRQKSPNERLRAALEERAETYLTELQKAAAGEGVYETLEPKDRVAINTKLLEWAIGRPATRKPDKESDGEEPDEGISIS